MNKLIIPEKALTQHIAAIGKTGSGKTTTCKLLVEHIVARGGRVCVLDPIKSDWWGLTSSANGKKPGLPFHILGGPRGHVPLHAQAGAAIGEIVANGSLPLSILDMADFEMGGLQQFFVHFAPMLLKKMRGVLHLVIEEAHEFAPKERAGFGNESMAIHFAKKLAVAGRSKGIRLIVATQRVQALHNALLGSCDTLIAHRLISPADQEPVVKWLKANLPPEKAKEVSASLQSLQTGEAWVCSGELGYFERQQFPRISTYDNTATPDSDDDPVEVQTGRVDHEKLRAIIGVAVEEAKANDPVELKKKLVVAETELRRMKEAGPKVHVPAPTLPPVEIRVPNVDQFEKVHGRLNVLDSVLRELKQNISPVFVEIERVVGEIKIEVGMLAKQVPKPPQFRAPSSSIPPPVARIPRARTEPTGDGKLGRAERAILVSIVSRHPKASNRAQAAVLSGYSIKSSSFSNALSALRSGGFIEGMGDEMRPTELGITTTPAMQPTTLAELQGRWLQKLERAERTILTALIEAYPNPLTRAEISEKTGYSETSSSFSNGLSALRSCELITRDRDPRATEILFEA